MLDVSYQKKNKMETAIRLKINMQVQTANQVIRIADQIMQTIQPFHFHFQAGSAAYL